MSAKTHADVSGPIPPDGLVREHLVIVCINKDVFVIRAGHVVVVRRERLETVVDDERQAGLGTRVRVRVRVPCDGIGVVPVLFRGGKEAAAEVGCGLVQQAQHRDDAVVRGIRVFV